MNGDRLIERDVQPILLSSLPLANDCISADLVPCDPRRMCLKAGGRISVLISVNVGHHCDNRSAGAMSDAPAADAPAARGQRRVDKKGSSELALKLWKQKRPRAVSHLREGAGRAWVWGGIKSAPTVTFRAVRLRSNHRKLLT